MLRLDVTSLLVFDVFMCGAVDSALGQEAAVRVKSFGMPVQELRIGRNSNQTLPVCHSLRNSEWLRDSICISAEEPQAIKSFGTRTVASDFTSRSEQRKSAWLFLTSLLL